LGLSSDYEVVASCSRVENLEVREHERAAMSADSGLIFLESAVTPKNPRESKNRSPILASRP